MPPVPVAAATTSGRDFRRLALPRGAVLSEASVQPSVDQSSFGGGACAGSGACAGGGARKTIGATG
eukprot:CAMPEP_0179879472 /NCGR_PEP_ID=MMETSP0982-20121206/26238_1 /TAXON_ID=483367 /ORGANISM="non described non described, Strain CCMP 2436" /LENGTH=65 /DNA_ID=CAMNT_0021772933 /DNA_START=202 /DNA_END=396 /DNA_ORIENTATION=+